MDPHSPIPRHARTPPPANNGGARILVAWSAGACAGCFFSGPVNSDNGSITLGAIFGFAAICTGALALLLIAIHERDWRYWLSLVLSSLALVGAKLHTVHYSGH